MTTDDVFEQRAASAGAALRAAFLEQGPTGSPRGAPSATGVGHVVRRARATGRDRRPRRTLAAAAVFVVGAFSVVVFALGAPGDAPSDVLTPAEGDTAVLPPSSLFGAGTLPDRPVQSVQGVPVPFTFSTPPQVPGARPWRYRVADLFDLGNGVGGLVVLAPTETYAPGGPWKGQTELVPAPTDVAGWARWLEQTGQVDVAERHELLIGGAPATRFTLGLGDLPAAYEGCGGGRTCVALAPMLDPDVGAARVGAGAQVGIDDETAEMTVIELEGRAVLVLTGGEPDRSGEWLPVLRAVVDSLRFA